MPEINRMTTKRTPVVERIIKTRLKTDTAKIKNITIDHIDNFANIKKVRITPEKIGPVTENKLKKFFQNIIKEKGEFKDWGGEKNDLFTTRIKICKERYGAAFAFKGKATKEPLLIKKMGKNGDQIQRLFETSANVFLIQFWGRINQSILKEMETHAIAKSVYTGTKIFYGIIDGVDTHRLKLAFIQEWRKEFKNNE